MENNEWERMRVEFSVSAVKTKTLRTSVSPKAWNHHCVTYEQATGTVAVYAAGN